MKNMSPVLALVLAAFGLSLTACSPAEFSMYDDSQPKSPNGSLGTPPVNVCDPFDSSNIVSPISGLNGSIHYLKDTDVRQSTSADMISVGTKINADLYMNNVFVPTRIFSAGFSTDSGSTIKNENDESLVEWFALNLKSKIRLAPGQDAGDYQLAILSDDGSTLMVQNAAGIFEPLVENENTHPTRMACATQTVAMTQDTRLPMNLSYFQGPRNHISLILMWRRVAPSASLSETECGATGNDYFFTVGTSTSPAVAKTPYTNLLSRGWTPLAAENYELQSGSNLCSASI